MNITAGPTGISTEQAGGIGTGRVLIFEPVISSYLR